MATSVAHADDAARHAALESNPPDTESATTHLASRTEHTRDRSAQRNQPYSTGAAKAREAAGNRDDFSDASSIRSIDSDDSAESLLIQDAGPAPPDYAAATANRANETAAREAAQRPATEEEPANEPRPVTSGYGTIQSPIQSPAGQEQNDEESTQRLSDEQQQQSPQSDQRGPFSDDPGLHWPFGNRRAFGPNFPWGPEGSPYSKPGFPFGPNGPPWGYQNHHYEPGQPGHEQSMTGGAYGDGPDEESSLLHGRRKWHHNQKRSKLRRCCSCLCLLALVLTIFVFGLIGLLVKVTKDSDTGNGGGWGDSDHPPRLRPNSTGPIRHPDTMSCEFNRYSERTKFGFHRPGTFSFVEMLERDYPFSGGIIGRIWILPAIEDQESDIKIWVSYATTAPWQVKNINFNTWDDSALQLEFPDVEREAESNDGRPCMDVDVTIYVRPDADISDWSIVSANLDIYADASLFGHKDIELTGPSQRSFSIKEKSEFSAIKGKVKLAYWSSRRTIIDTSSGSVAGTYALLDSLEIHTRSGQINVSVDPKPEDSKRPVPAEFTATTLSGSIQAIFPDESEENLPDRSYTTRVDTNSGSIRGSYLMGISSTFASRSGSINVGITPYISSLSSTALLRTSAHSGHTSVRIASPYGQSGAPFGNLQSVHKAESGAMDLIYPSEWEGTIEGRTASGSIDVHGKGVYIKESNSIGRVGKHIRAEKGDGDSHADFSTSSGSVNFLVGEDS